MKNWQKIFASTNRIQASLVRDVLEGNQIEAILMDKQDSSYGIFGQLEVYVNQEKVLPALKVIKDEIRFE